MANWVAKSANLLVDGLGSPERVGLLLPLHWQSFALLLASVSTGAEVVLAGEPAELAGCAAAFVLGEDASAALDAGVDDVFALSGHPLGARVATTLPALPGLVLDYAVEVPSYADHFGGTRPGPARVGVGGARGGGQLVVPMPGFGSQDRVLTALALSDPAGAALALGVLHGGGSLVLLAGGHPAKSAAGVSRAERVTQTAGVDVPGLTRRA